MPEKRLRADETTAPRFRGIPALPIVSSCHNRQTAWWETRYGGEPNSTQLPPPSPQQGLLRGATRAVLPAEAVRPLSLKRPSFAAGPHRLGSGAVGMQVRVGER